MVAASPAPIILLSSAATVKEEKHLKAWALTLGLGAAIGAVAVLMMPRDNPTRKLAAQTACKVEDAAARLGNKLNMSDTIC